MINELAYVLRIQGRSARAAGARRQGGRAPGGGPAGGRWSRRDGALRVRRDDRRRAGMLAPLDAVPVDALSRDWQALFAFRRMICHLTSGDEPAMLMSATRCTELAGDTTMRHAAALAALVRRRLRRQPSPPSTTSSPTASAARSTASRSAPSPRWSLASTGRVDEAIGQLAATEAAAGDGPLVPADARLPHRHPGPRSPRRAATTPRPAPSWRRRSPTPRSTDPVGWLAATRWLPLAYVLVPSSRSVIERAFRRARCTCAGWPSPVPSSPPRPVRPSTQRSLDGISPSAIVTAVPRAVGDGARRPAARRRRARRPRPRDVAAVAVRWRCPRRLAPRRRATHASEAGRASCSPRFRSRQARSGSMSSARPGSTWRRAPARTGSASGCARCCCTSSSTVRRGGSRSATRCGPTSTRRRPTATCV